MKKYLNLWLDSIQAEVDSLSVQKEAILRVHPNLVEKLLQENPNAKILPGKGVFTIKPPCKFKTRGVVCGNFVGSTHLDKNEIYSGGVDITSLRLVLRIAGLYGWHVGSTDVSTAFLNAVLNLPYMIIVWCPKIFAEAGVCDHGEAWIVRKALYGLRESPRAWGDERDIQLRQLTITSWGMPHRLRQLATDPSVWLIEPCPVDFVKKAMRQSSKSKPLMPPHIYLLIKQFVG